MRNMQRSLIAAVFVWMAAMGLYAASADLGQVQKIYLLPMGAGMDQYLANQLTARGVFQVVTDPQQADAILTEEIGGVFETQLQKLYPPPAEPAKEETAEGNSGENNMIEPAERPRSSFSRGKGNLFLVSRQSRQVVWSIYHLPKDRSAKEMHKAAGKIVEELSKTLGR